MEIIKVVVFVELADGNVHQVGISEERTGEVLQFLAGKDGGLVLAKDPEPFKFSTGTEVQASTFKKQKKYDC